MLSVVHIFTHIANNLHSCRMSANTATSKSMTPRWTTRPVPICPYSAFSDNSRFSSIYYVDVGTSARIDSIVKPGGFIMVSITNPLYLNATFKRLKGNGTSSLQLNITNPSLPTGGPVKRAHATLAPENTNLFCSQSNQNVDIVFGCPPTKKLVYRLGYTLDDYRELPPITLWMRGQVGNPFFHYIPVNYRPPSKLGKGIPTSANIYNSNPNAGRHRNFFELSKKSGSYKTACSTGTCVCTEEMEFSELEKYTDCRKKAKKVFYNLLYMPDLRIYQNGVDIGQVEYPLRLVEVNGREDYCFNHTSCSGAPSDRDIEFRLSDHHAIVWKGDELYHFRVESINGTHCELVTEMQARHSSPLSSCFYSYRSSDMVAKHQLLHHYETQGNARFYVLHFFHPCCTQVWVSNPPLNGTIETCVVACTGTHQRIA